MQGLPPHLCGSVGEQAFSGKRFVRQDRVTAAQTADNDGQRNRHVRLTAGQRRQNAFDRFEDCLRARANSIVLRQVDPPDRALRIHQELRRPRDVTATLPGAGVRHPVAVNHFGLGVREKCVGVTLAFTEFPRLFARIDTDGGDFHFAGAEFIQMLLETP